jgi:hypothetical protein
MIGETPVRNHSGCSAITVSGPVMIFMWSVISYLSASVVNWFANAKCSEMMKNAAGWSWKRCLGWILPNLEIGDWGWFRLVFGLLYWSKCLCVLRLLITNRILEFCGMDL